MRWPWRRRSRVQDNVPAAPKFVMTTRRMRALDFVADLLDLVDELELEDAIVGLVDGTSVVQHAELSEDLGGRGEDESQHRAASEDTPTPDPEVHSEDEQEVPSVPTLSSHRRPEPAPVAASPERTGPAPDAHAGEVTEAMLQKRAELAARRAGVDPADVPVAPPAPRTAIESRGFARPRIITKEQIDAERGRA